MKNCIRIPAALLLFILSPLLHAQDQFKLPYEQFELPNGLKVVLYKDTSLPVVAVNMVYRAGSALDEKGKSGLANIVGAMMLQGSKHISSKRFLNVMDECGASFGGMVDVDKINFWSIFPARYLETALWIESDRLGFSAQTFTAVQLDSIRKKIIRESERTEKTIPVMAKQLLYAALYPPAHPYSWLTSGKIHEVAKLKLKDVQSFTSKYIVPANASLCIGGNFDFARAKELVKKYFADIPKQKTPGINGDLQVIPPPKSQNISIEKSMDNSRLYLVFQTVPAGAHDESVLHLIARILSGDRFARLTKTLILTQKIAVDIQSYQSSQQFGGTFWIVVACRPEVNLMAVYNGVMKELDNLATEPIEESELTSIKNKLRNSMLSPLEHLGGFSGRVDALNMANLFTGNPGSALNLLHSIDLITPVAIKTAASQYLKPERCITLSVVQLGKSNLALPTN